MMGQWNISDLIKKKKLLINYGYRAKNAELSIRGIPFARAGNLNDGFHFSGADCFPEEDLHKVGLKISIPGDVVFTSKGTVGRFAFVKQDTPQFVYSPQLCFWRVLDEQLINQIWLYYWMCSKEFYEQYIEVSDQTDMAAYVNLRDQKNMRIVLPPLPEQKAIASVLSSLDDKIELLHRQNKSLEAMAETLFRQWFVEETQDDWKEIRLEHFFDFLEGPGIRNWQYTESGTPFVNIRLISNGDIEVSKANCVSNEEAIGKYSHFHLKEGDMIVSTSGTLGKKAIVRSYHLPLLLNTSVIRFRPRDGRSYAFIYQYLNSRIFQEHLESSASGSVQANFGPTHLKQMTLNKPPQSVIEKYLSQADPIYEKLKTNQVQIKTLEKLRDTLLSKLMSGEVRVAYTES